MGSRLDTGLRYTVKAFFFIKKKMFKCHRHTIKKEENLCLGLKILKKINNVE
jgi:hypothetical protein